MTDCIFCKIISGQISCKKIYEDNQIFVFHDIEPVAPVHAIILPKVHIASAMDINFENSEYIARLFEIIPMIANELELEEGFRIVNNYGFFGGQSVEHIHFHLLGRRPLGWPPG